MTVKDFVLEHGGTRHICMENIYKVPYETLVELVKLKCKEQREICAGEADADLNVISPNCGRYHEMEEGLDYEIAINRSSILNAPEPEF